MTYVFGVPHPLISQRDLIFTVGISTDRNSSQSEGSYSVPSETFGCVVPEFSLEYFLLLMFKDLVSGLTYK